MENYHAPEFQKTDFNCPHCNVYSAQLWGTASAFPNHYGLTVEGYSFSKCEHCEKWCCWHDEVMIMPPNAPVALPHMLMPESCKKVYEEARSIVSQSPKAAAALIRLALQLLMKEVGEKGKKIDDDIQSLVNKGLDDHIQAALDYCRVVGNEAVHPGEIQVDDDPSIAHSLFEMINLIVEDRIAKPARVRKFVGNLPEGARKRIEARAPKNKAP